MAKIGYARVSTDEQLLDLQTDALKAAGCDRVFVDEGVSGAVNPHRREGFAAAMAALETGDTFAVWKLDRIGRSLADLIAIMGEFEAHGVEFQSVTDGIDTRTAGGRLVFHMMGALAEFERSLIAERTREGMKAAMKRGRHVGRPPALSPQQVDHARRLIERGEETPSSMASLYGVGRSTMWRALSGNEKV